MTPFGPENALLQQIDDPLRLLQGLFAHSPIGVQLYDAAGRSLFVNKAFIGIFGIAPSPEYCVLRDELAVRYGVDHLIRAAFEGKVTTLRVTWYDPRELEHVKVTEGRRCAIECLMVPILDSLGKVKHVVFFHRDVTPEASLEREKQEVEKKLAEANRVIEALMNGTQAVIYAKDLEGRYLFVNRQYGRVLNLNSVVAGYMMRKFAGEAVPVELHLDPGECNVCADPTQVEQVLLNLCVNSRDALNGQGRIRISTGLEHLHAGTKGLRLDCPPGRYAWFEVDDDGPGMNPTVLERAFDPFFTTKARQGGSGLGLASVFGIVRESGGTLRVSTAPGFGCAVRVYLPATECALKPESGPRAAEPPMGSGTVIVVEDEPLLREITARILRQWGFRVLEARDGAEVPRLFRENPGVTLLLTDVFMPGESGPAMVKSLEGEGLLNGVGVVFVSGYSSDELSRYGFRAGSMHLLEKPFTAGDLLAKIREALSSATPLSRGPQGPRFSPSAFF